MITAEKMKAIDFFSEGRKLYKLMHFSDAKKSFQDALDLCSDDGPSQVYLERCEYYIDNPPPDDWDGVYMMTTK